MGFHHFPFIGQESEWAAEAAECAGEQNKFWAYANYLYTHKVGENTRALSRNHLKQFAAQLGLDTNAFNACFDSKYAAVVQQDFAEGQARRINSTPTFIINGQEYVGLISADRLAALIDSLQRIERAVAVWG